MDAIALIARLSPSKQRLVRELVWNLAQLERLTIPEDHDARLDYHELTHQWLSYLVSRGLSGDTIRGYRGDIARLLAASPHPTQVHIEAYLASIITAGRQPGTVDRIVDSCHSFFGYLARLHIISINPSSDLSRPQLPKQPRKPPTDLQVQTLLAIPKDTRHQAIIVLMVDCGLRVAEVATARISETDTCQRLITVTGKKRKTRSIPMSHVTASFLTSYIDSLLHLGYSGDWLFPGQNPDSHIATDSIRDYMQKLCDRAGIGRVSPHQLRHYFATYMLTAGASLKAVSVMLGHENISTTTNTYWHIINERLMFDEHDKHSPMRGDSLAKTLGK